LRKENNITIERMLFLLIVLTAFALRFWNFTALPFMHDEFSALFRAQVDDVIELIYKGIIPDAHPPGVEMFVYFIVKTFGVSEPVLKFPFLLMGVGSVIAVYYIGKNWFGETTALLASAFFTVVQYNIFYSQIIRPYEPGLFFGLLTTFFWTKIVFDENRKTYVWILFILFMTLNSYIHAFSIFFNVLLAVSGLFFLKKHLLKKYLLSGVIIFVLFLPGFLIFLKQLERGDIGGWLGKPTPYFLWDYFSYIFHFSWFFFGTVTFVTFYLARKKFNSDKKVYKFRFLSLIWFVITFVTAYLYSVIRVPVIQYSTLYFVFPFLMLSFFSIAGYANKKVLTVSVLAILFAGISSLVLDREHYRLMYHQGFNEIPHEVLNDIKQFHKDNVAIVLLASNVKMYDYYFNKYGEKPDCYVIENNNEFKEVNIAIKKQNPDILLVGIADYAPMTFLEIFKSEFPYVIKRLTSYNMEYWALSKNECRGCIKADSFATMLQKKVNIIMNEKDKYKGGITLNVDTIEFDEYDIINVVANVSTKENVDAILVFDWKKENGESYFWAGSNFMDFSGNNPTKYNVAFSSRMMNFVNKPSASKMKFYIWKRDKSDVDINTIKVYKTKMDALEFGLFKKIH
jgi:hypothetical protein